jgi:hypothetical protein
MRIALDRGDTALAHYYRMALAALGDEAVEPALRVLTDEHELIALRDHAFAVVQQVAPVRLAAVAAVWLSSPREHGPMRTAMIRQLEAGDGPLPKPVVDIAWDPDAPPIDREPLIRADPDDATDLLRRMLRGDDATRQAAVAQLARTKNPALRPVVEEAAAAGDPKVQQQLNAALAAMKGPDWGDVQMTGPADTPNAGDNRTAWASVKAEEGAVTIELDFPHPVVPERVRVHETYNPGAIVKLEALVHGRFEPLWTGEPGTVPGARWFEPRIAEIGVETRTIRLTLDTDAVKGWNEIDAIELVGGGRSQWAEAARSSSCYARR